MGIRLCHLSARLAYHRLALALWSRDHTLGPPGTVPAADPVSRAKPGTGRIAGLAPLRVQRSSANRRPSVDDLFAAVPGLGAHRRGAEPVGPRCHGARLRVPGRRRTDAVVSRSTLALGRWSYRCARV